MSKLISFLKALNLYYPPTPKPYEVVNPEPVLTPEQIAEDKKKAANAKRAATRKANKLAKQKGQA
jgi:hypothetical protein